MFAVAAGRSGPTSPEKDSAAVLVVVVVLVRAGYWEAWTTALAGVQQLSQRAQGEISSVAGADSDSLGTAEVQNRPPNQRHFEPGHHRHRLAGGEATESDPPQTRRCSCRRG